MNKYAAGNRLWETELNQSVASVLETISEGFIAYDRDLNYCYCNARAEEMTGLKREDLLGRSMIELFPHYSGLPIADVLNRVKETGAAEVLEYFSPVINGWIRARLLPANGGVVAYFSDVTDSKKWQDSANYLEALTHSLKDALISIDANNAIVSWNSAAQRMYGWTAPEAMGKPARELIPTEFINEDEPPSWNEFFKLNDYWEGEVRQRRKDGSFVYVYSWLGAMKSATGEFSGCVSLNRDLTSEKKAEETEMKLAAIVEFSDDAIISKNLDGIIQSWNKGAEQIFGYQAAEVIGKHISILIPQDHLSEETTIITKIKSGRPIEHYETVRRTKRGNLINVSLTVSPIKDSRGNIIGASKIARNITEQKRAEIGLRESENRFRILAENIQSMAWMASPDGFIFWCNQRWYDYLGLSFETIKGRSWEATVHPDHVERVRVFLEAAWKKGEPWELTFPLRNKNGEYRLFLTSGFPVRSQGELLRWIGTCTDIENIKQGITEQSPA